MKQIISRVQIEKDLSKFDKCYWCQSENSQYLSASLHADCTNQDNFSPCGCPFCADKWSGEVC